MGHHFDYIISGAGCAGLSLAFKLVQKGLLKGKQLLIIDRERKTANDRTWCFWESKPGAFDAIVTKRWQHLNFFGDNFESITDISPFQYKMIKGIDFYNFVYEKLKEDPAVSFRNASIVNIGENDLGAFVATETEKFNANWVFNSILFNAPEKSKYNYLAQHFKGWEIKTEKASFNPDQATFMDFRISQNDETRFVYVLPTDERTAMVEATIFSKRLLESDDYDKIIRDYIDNYLSINNYEILHEEYGVIPMTDYPFKLNKTKRILQLGTAGGQVKASTGFAFTRIQERVDTLISAIEQNSLNALPGKAATLRYAWYDSILLNVMINKRVSAREIFTPLFKRNKTQKILRFLNEKTNFWEELIIMSACPKLPFMAALIDEIRKSIFSRNRLVP